MTPREFATVIKPLRDHCVSENRSEAERQSLLDVYFEILRDLPPQAVAAAVVRHLAEQRERWFPAVGLLRSYAVEWIEGTPASHGEVWEAVLKLVRRHGSYIDRGKLKLLPQPVLAGIAAAGGWMTLCDMQTKDRAIHGAQFRNGYLEALKRENTQTVVPIEARPKIASQYRPLLENCVKSIEHEDSE